LAKKKKVVRRAWSKEDVRTLKTMAREKKGVKKNRQGIEANHWRNECDGSKA
jgi:hypothetical protein